MMKKLRMITEKKDMKSKEVEGMISRTTKNQESIRAVDDMEDLIRAKDKEKKVTTVLITIMEMDDMKESTIKITMVFDTMTETSSINKSLMRFDAMMILSMKKRKVIGTMMWRRKIGEKGNMKITSMKVITLLSNPMENTIDSISLSV